MPEYRFTRITPDMVEQAYEVTGLIPGRDEWYYQESPGRCYACGLMAVLAQRFHDAGLPLPEMDVGWNSTDILIGLVLPRVYVFGYTWGFDGKPFIGEAVKGDFDDPEQALELMRMGYEDGKAAWERVKDRVPGAWEESASSQI